jgi:septum formation protein
LKIVLASASASRAHLLRSAGVMFEVRPANVDEETIRRRLSDAGASPDTIAVELAEHKAKAVSRTRPNDLVIAGDQLLSFDGNLIGKCGTIGEARELLVRLRGRSHTLIGGLVLAHAHETLWRHVSRAQLTMRDFDDSFLDRYLVDEGPALLSSVGCYRLEGQGAQLFDAIDGSYFAILGLDMLPLLKALRAQKAIAA